MTSKVQAHMISINVKAGRIEQAVRTAVMSNLEDRWAGRRERGFFIGNAEHDFVKAGGTKHQFAGGLAAMAKKGDYQPSQDAEYVGKYGYFIVQDHEEIEE